MTKRRVSKLIHEGQYVAEVEVEFIYVVVVPSVPNALLILAVCRREMFFQQ
jgi:hypothetical protein